MARPMPDRNTFVGDTKPKNTLNDSDIATYQRRTGPSGAVPASDADTHAHAHTDSDTAPKAGTDADTAPATDRDR